MDRTDAASSVLDAVCAVVFGTAACGGLGADTGTLCAEEDQATVYRLRAQETEEPARLEQALAVLERRLQGPGLCDLEARVDDDGTLVLRVVSLAGADPLDPALLDPGVLQLYLVDDTRDAGAIALGYAVLPDTNGAPVMVRWESLLPPDPVESAVAIERRRGVAVVLTDAGAAAFAEATMSHTGEIIAMTLDDVVLTAPRIRSTITSGTLPIFGDFSVAEAIRLAAILNGGSLPDGLDLQLVSTERVDVR